MEGLPLRAKRLLLGGKGKMRGGNYGRQMRGVHCDPSCLLLIRVVSTAGSYGSDSVEQREGAGWKPGNFGMSGYVSTVKLCPSLYLKERRDVSHSAC